MSLRTHILSASAVLTLASAASAATTGYFSKANWDAAAGPDTTLEDFNSLTPGTVIPNGGELVTPSGMTISRSNNPGDNGALVVASGTTFGNIDGTTFIDAETGGPLGLSEVVTLTFPEPVKAFGAFWGDPDTGSGIALEVGDDTFQIDQISGFNVGWFGVVSDTAFSEVRIIRGDNPVFQELYSFDNVEFAIIPEPTSVALLSLGGLGLIRRRR